MDLRHERGWGNDEGEESAHLPERRKSFRDDRVGEEGSVVGVLEVRSVPFRPHREGRGGYGDREGRRREKPGEREREMAVVEVTEEPERRRVPTARQVEMGGRNGGRGEGKGVVEVLRSEGGRTLYRVR